jgi:hypothetical protein
MRPLRPVNWRSTYEPQLWVHAEFFFVWILVLLVAVTFGTVTQWANGAQPRTADAVLAAAVPVAARHVERNPETHTSARHTNIPAGPTRALKLPHKKSVASGRIGAPSHEGKTHFGGADHDQ